MNKSETIIQHIQEGRPKNGWAVFPFKTTSTWFSILWEIFTLVVSGSAANMFLFLPPAPTSKPEDVYIGYVAVFAAAIACIAFIFSVRRLLLAKKSYLVITDEELVKSFCGKVEEFPLKNISNLRLTQLRGTSGFKPRYRIEFVDTRTRRIELLAQNTYFGDETAIFNTLNSKLS